MKKYQNFLSENFQFLVMKFSIYLNRRVFVIASENIYQNETKVTFLLKIFIT